MNYLIIRNEPNVSSESFNIAVPNSRLFTTGERHTSAKMGLRYRPKSEVPARA